MFSGRYLKQWKGCAFDKRKDSTSIRNDKKEKITNPKIPKFQDNAL